VPVLITVGESASGQRLDRFVSGQVDGLSTRDAARLAAAGQVLVNGHRVPKGRRLAAGDRVEIRTEEIASHASDFPASADPVVEVRVLHRDARTLVADKPAGMHTAPLRGSESGTLLGGVIAIAPGAGTVRGHHAREGGLVHRLDRDTSGACLFALDQDAFDRLRTASESDLVVKDYLAIVEGVMDEGSVTLEATIPPGRGRRVHVRSVVRRRGHGLAPTRSADGTRVVRMRVEAGRKARSITTVRVKLTRGFRHQVRAVLAALGHPIVGDDLYGSHEAAGGLMLHGTRIVFPHPADGRLTRVDSPPERLEACWRLLSGGPC
jgi:RluA family pseudouridine synthase